MRKSYSSREIVAFLKTRGWEYKSRDKDYQVKVCPFCGDARYKFYVHKSGGHYQCFHCRQKGSFKTLQNSLGATIQSFNDNKKYKSPHKRWILNAHKRLLKSKAGKKYLKERGIKSSTYKHFKLGV